LSSWGIIVLSAPLFKSRFAQSFVQVIQTNIPFFVDIHEKQAIWDFLPAFQQLLFSFPSPAAALFSGEKTGKKTDPHSQERWSVFALFRK
jgi:putative NADH-flavin reductase